MRARFAPYLVLLGGVLAVASAAILIRLLQRSGVPTLAIAAGRLGIAALILLPIALIRVRPAIGALTRRELLLGITAGVLLALHFAAWIASLRYTSVASSVALVATNPLWVGLLSLLVLRERLSAPMLLGIGLTFGGSVLIGLSDASGANAPSALLGNGLALLGAMTVSGYLLIGRGLRALPTLVYIWLVYTSAALVLLAFGLATGAFAGIGGWDASVGLPLIGLAVGPQLLGHSAFNYAMRRLSATFVAVALLSEPIGAALLAWLLFGEQFAGLQLAGFALLLAGIAAATRAEQRRTEPTAAEIRYNPSER